MGLGSGIQNQKGTGPRIRIRNIGVDESILQDRLQRGYSSTISQFNFHRMCSTEYMLSGEAKESVDCGILVGTVWRKTFA
jgi:hypothetical protein